MQLGELARIVATHVREEQVLSSGWRSLGRDVDIEAVRLFYCSPAIDMQGLWITPPLLSEVVEASFGAVTEREADVMQFYVRITAPSANVKHKEFHRTLAPSRYPE
ncbi:hypothetical protein CHELA40_40118 [Chelatococcus asaccharovorans]|nr:hypothetical protein CHELA17_50076 [Chelatococcus asaccharovorans]CAH1689866.1 hypothetical protein CHELA40_40118 [Chelatococcus asaccharovorans]